MQIRKKMFGATIIFCAVMLVSIPFAAAQGLYPTKPITILNPIGTGTPDLLSRTLGESLSKELNVNVNVAYKVGGSGMIGADFVAKGAPDGYTILCGSSSSNLFGPVLNPKSVPYDTIKDFAPIAYAGYSPTVIIVNSQSPFKTFDDLLYYAKKNPGKLNMGTVGVGTSVHFVLEIINYYTGSNIVHIPNREGTAQVITSVLGGHVDMGMMGISAAMPLVKAGKVRALVATAKIPALPDVPTLVEKNIPQAAGVNMWIAFFVPVKTPKAIQDKLASAFAKAIKEPETVQKLGNVGFIVDYKPPEELAEQLKYQMEVMTKVATAAKMIK